MSCDIRPCLAGVVLILLSLVVGQADAQTNSPLPDGMTQQQYDELVKSVGESVLQSLTAKGLVAKPLASPLATKPIEVDEEAVVAERVREALGEVPKVFGRYPEVWTDLAELPNRLDGTTAGGRGLWAYLGLLAITAAAALLAEAGVGRITLAKRNVIAQQFAAAGGPWCVAALALLDGANGKVANPSGCGNHERATSTSPRSAGITGWGQARPCGKTIGRSALPPKADLSRLLQFGWKVPVADIRPPCHRAPTLFASLRMRGRHRFRFR